MGCSVCFIDVFGSVVILSVLHLTRTYANICHSVVSNLAQPECSGSLPAQCLGYCCVIFATASVITSTMHWWALSHCYPKELAQNWLRVTQTSSFSTSGTSPEMFFTGGKQDVGIQLAERPTPPSNACHIRSVVSILY